jgi:hypothetical protein
MPVSFDDLEEIEMEIMNVGEVFAIDTTPKALEPDFSELLDLQLAMVGGGMGDTQL